MTLVNIIIENDSQMIILSIIRETIVAKQIPNLVESGWDIRYISWNIKKIRFFYYNRIVDALADKATWNAHIFPCKKDVIFKWNTVFFVLHKTMGYQDFILKYWMQKIDKMIAYIFYTHGSY